MATYRATVPVYVDDAFVREGALFTTDAPKGDTWEEIDPLDHDGDGRKGGSPKGERSTASKGKAASAASSEE